MPAHAQDNVGDGAILLDVRRAAMRLLRPVTQQDSDAAARESSRAFFLDDLRPSDPLQKPDR